MKAKHDDVALYNGADGYSLVDLNGGNLPGSNSVKNETVDSSDGSSVVQIKKRNAGGFAIDGGRNGANGQNVYLWSEDSGNENQQWIETHQGNGYYTYQKQNTNFCMDEGKSGANRQNVYLWTCNSNNYKQHWKKEDAGSGYFKLIKRGLTQITKSYPF